MAKIGIIGIGNMGSAILKGLLHVYGKNDIIFTDVNREKCEEITKETGVAYAGSNAECANQAKYIILAVKPQYFDPVLKNIRNVVTEANVIISIAPGITIGQLKEKLGIEKRDPALYCLAAERSGVPPQSCLLFEDSPSYCAAARQAGFTVVGVFDPLFAPRWGEMEALCHHRLERFADASPTLWQIP